MNSFLRLSVCEKLIKKAFAVAKWEAAIMRIFVFNGLVYEQ